MTLRDQTIYARASGAGRAGVAVFRLSGPDAFAMAGQLTGAAPPPRSARLVNFICPDTEQLIDRGLAILFKGPASFTGEDIAEFHLHGSAAVEEALYKALAGLGARPAAAGEFTRRALMNGKLDLAQTEALADLIDAETSQQRQQALGQLDGRLSAVAEGWRARLVAILAPLEADVDFPDEGDLPDALAGRAGPVIDGLITELAQYQTESAAARAIREGVSIAIMGRPNAGKSSLLNLLAGSNTAIVSSVPGTTRDVVEVRLNLGGAPVILADTAGLRDQGTDEIEREGMRRALKRAEEAHIRLMVIDPLTDGPDFMRDSRQITQKLRAGDFIVWNKADLTEGRAEEKLRININGIEEASLSAKTGAGAPRFIEKLTERVKSLLHVTQSAALTRARHVAAVNEATAALARARASLAVSPELAAEDVRLAARALGGITGAVDVEDVLDAIFSSFCIGK